MNTFLIIVSIILAIVTSPWYLIVTAALVIYRFTVSSSNTGSSGGFDFPDIDFD